jgi:hypothetical protein
VNEETAARIGRNEAVFRVANEERERLASEAGLAELLLVCECGYSWCKETIVVAPEDYRRVPVAPGSVPRLPGPRDRRRGVRRGRSEGVGAKRAYWLWRNVPACRRISRRRQIHVVEQLSEDGSVDAETARRIAENEVRFRAANEKVKAAGTRLGASEQTLPFVCECGRGECLRVLRLTIPQYEQGRQNARYFICAPATRSRARPWDASSGASGAT